MFLGYSTEGLAEFFEERPPAKNKSRRKTPLVGRNCDQCGTFFFAINNELRCSEDCMLEARAKAKRSREKAKKMGMGQAIKER